MKHIHLRTPGEIKYNNVNDIFEQSKKLKNDVGLSLAYPLTPMTL